MVRIGQELVAPFITNSDGKTIKVKPMASIKADVFYNTITSVAQNQILYKDTQNNYYATEMVLFNNSIYNNKDICPYKHYRIEVIEEWIGNKNILPIKYVKTKYIEQEQIIEKNYFTNNQQQIINQCKEKTRQLCASYDIIKDEYYNVSETAGIVNISYTIITNKDIG